MVKWFIYSSQYSVLGDRSCENAYEEGITYFGDQVSLFNLENLLSASDCSGNKKLGSFPGLKNSNNPPCNMFCHFDCIFSSYAGGDGGQCLNPRRMRSNLFKGGGLCFLVPPCKPEWVQDMVVGCCQVGFHCKQLSEHCQFLFPFLYLVTKTG